MEEKLENSCSISPEEVEDKRSYRIIKEERIKQLLTSDISHVSAVLRISRGLACTLLRRYKGSLTLLFDEWFTHNERVLNALGVLSEQNMRIDDRDHDDNSTLLSSALCGAHPFSPDCWKNYIAGSVDEYGQGLPCPMPGCKAEAGIEVVDAFASDEDKEKYYHYLVQSYVDGHFHLRRCPRPGCGLVIYHDRMGSYDVTCDCSHRFCWYCLKENHHPVDCETANKWLLEPLKEHFDDEYAHYYEKWDSNNKLERVDVDNLNRDKDEFIETLSSSVVEEALERIVESRSVLKWSYAHGYYLCLAKPEKKALFEFMQGEAEAVLERLHRFAEMMKFERYLDAKHANHLRTKLRNLTDVTRIYFENFVLAMMSDLRIY